jgi:cell fate regulator YaaT (PSP1 superfamily)
MKLIDAQYTFDNSKLLFYFSSSGRVDFRDLVKDLASVFRTRIELRQIGIRDEAKLIGGLGLCGRPLCCSVFLNNFGQVSIKMAKEQNLSLNSSKISGICGRLMCCLHFEHETYEYEIKRTPPVDSVVKTSDGIGTVCEISPLTGMIKVRLHDKADTPPKPYHRDAVTLISKKQKNENPQ